MRSPTMAMSVWVTAPVITSSMRAFLTTTSAGASPAPALIMRVRSSVDVIDACCNCPVRTVTDRGGGVKSRRNLRTKRRVDFAEQGLWELAMTQTYDPHKTTTEVR